MLFVLESDFYDIFLFSFISTSYERSLSAFINTDCLPCFLYEESFIHNNTDAAFTHIPNYINNYLLI